MADRIEAEVRLHGTPVGTLSYDRGGSTFDYRDDVQSVDHEVLGQIFEEAPRTRRRVKVGLPAWFANLLPEGEMRRQLEQEIGRGRVNDYRLLMRLGDDLPGAVTVHPGGDADETADDWIDPATPPDEDRADRWSSLTGVQLKWSVHSSRLTMPVHGPEGWWIAKLPDRSVDKLAENEYLTMLWLQRAGFDVPPVELLPAKAIPVIPAGFADPDEPIYLVRRFDRTAQGRVHVEDFAQISDVEPEFKYGQGGATYDSMALVVEALTGRAGLTAYLDRLVAAIVVGNTDAHLKNWAVTYPDGRTPALSPVYDFHSLTIYRTRFRYPPLALTLAGQQMPSLIDIDHFRRLADACGIEPDVAVDGVRRTVDALRTAWDDGVGAEAARRFPALAAHYQRRLADLPVAQE